MTRPARKAHFARAAEDEFLGIRHRYAEEASEIAESFHAEVMRAVAASLATSWRARTSSRGRSFLSR